MSKNNGQEQVGRRRKRGVGTQLDAMKRIRKDIPATRVMKPKSRTRPDNNWRDLLPDNSDDMDDWRS